MARIACRVIILNARLAVSASLESDEGARSLISNHISQVGVRWLSG